MLPPPECTLLADLAARESASRPGAIRAVAAMVSRVNVLHSPEQFSLRSDNGLSAIREHWQPPSESNRLAADRHQRQAQ